MLLKNNNLSHVQYLCYLKSNNQRSFIQAKILCDDKQQIFFLVCPHQVRCQHRRQYRPHRVSQLRRGNKEYNSAYFINVVTDSLQPTKIVNTNFNLIPN